jgi:hypothetical protein
VLEVTGVVMYYRSVDDPFIPEDKRAQSGNTYTCRNLSVLVMLWLLDYHDGAVCVMGTVVTDAPENSPLDGSVAVAADGEHLSVVPLDGLAEDVPGVWTTNLSCDALHISNPSST